MKWEKTGLNGTTMTDNDDPSVKLYLRRYFLQKYHAETEGAGVVLDCCQGEAVLWTPLRREFPHLRYVGVDRKPKKGRLFLGHGSHGDSARLLQAPGLPYDVIDVDTYGSPWNHYMTMLPNIIKPTTVFLTLGALNITAVDNHSVSALGIKFSRAVPHTLRARLRDLALDACLAKSYHYGVRIIEAQEVLPPGLNARYFGVRLQPPTTRAT